MTETVEGVLKLTKKGAGTLRAPSKSFRASGEDPLVPRELVEQNGLVEGAAVVGQAKRGKRGCQVASIETVGGLSPDVFQRRTPFAELTAVDPCERFDLSAGGDTSMRIVDLVAPIGKGTRGLVVSPPRAGKTMLLEQIAQAIRHDSPETRIVVLLVDERPEEVTHFRRAVDAEVLASSSDQSGDRKSVV